MHNVFTLKIRGQVVAGLWVSRVQLSGLCAAGYSARRTMWLNPATFARQSHTLYTAIHTANLPFLPPLTATFYPVSTGPIKNSN